MKIEFKYTIEVVTPSGKISRKDVKIKANNSYEADKIVEKKYPKAIDIQRFNGWEDDDNELYTG